MLQSYSDGVCPDCHYVGMVAHNAYHDELGYYTLFECEYCGYTHTVYDEPEPQPADPRDCFKGDE